MFSKLIGVLVLFASSIQPKVIPVPIDKARIDTQHSPSGPHYFYSPIG